jgi:predicted HTH transcriptional regulator
MDDIDAVSLRQYRNQFRIINDGHIWNNEDDKDFLKKLGGYAVDRRTGKEGLTIAGLMMFGTGMAIRERFSNFRMDYVDMSHLVGDERYRDRLTYDGRWENNLYQFFTIVLPRITFDLPRPFKMIGMQRIDDTPQYKAVREALTNSVIHSDILMDAGVLRIDKYDDKLCFRNPGNLKLPITQIYEGGSSKARNPRIQNMLRMIGYGENLGSGFPIILSAWKETGWKMPILENKLELNEVTLTLPLESASEDSTDQKPTRNRPETDQKIGQISYIEEVDTGRKTDQKTDQKTEIIEIIRCNPYINRSAIAKALGIHDSSVKRRLEALVAEHRICRVGSDKGGYWKVL